jgi:uncharacterized protein
VANQAAPISAHDRIEVLDVLRGFALLGILLVNMHFFALPFTSFAVEPHGYPDLPDRVSEWIIRFAAQAKFYTLFSFLFGLGFAIFVTRAEEKGRRGGTLFARRLLVLLLIGTIHAFLIWPGDILMTYAIGGFVLLMFRNRKPKTLLVWAAILTVLAPLVMFGFAGLIALGMQNPEARPEIERDLAKQDQTMHGIYDDGMIAYSSDSFARVTARRASDVAVYWSWALFFMPSVLAMFLVGLWAHQRGIFPNLRAHLPFIRKVWAWTLPIGIIGNVVMTYVMEHASPVVPSFFGATGQLFGAIGAPALSMFYASSLVLMWHAGWRQRLHPLTYVGRMALSNYLLQSLVCTLIFYGYGLGMFAKVRPLYWIPLAVAIYATQIPLSKWWMSRYQFGPVEWLWRMLTYGRLQPMRPELASTASSG